MRLMSFALTTDAMIAARKTVTRRLGWKRLKTGDRIRAVDRLPFRANGQSVRDLGVIEIISVRSESLAAILQQGQEEVEREGCGKLSAEDFVEMFCRQMHCQSDAEIRRIEFRVVSPSC